MVQIENGTKLVQGNIFMTFCALNEAKGMDIKVKMEVVKGLHLCGLDVRKNIKAVHPFAKPCSRTDGKASKCQDQKVS